MQVCPDGAGDASSTTASCLGPDLKTARSARAPQATPGGSDLPHCLAVVGPFRPPGPGPDSCIEGTTRSEPRGPDGGWGPPPAPSCPAPPLWGRVPEGLTGLREPERQRYTTVNRGHTPNPSHSRTRQPPPPPETGLGRGESPERGMSGPVGKAVEEAQFSHTKKQKKKSGLLKYDVGLFGARAIPHTQKQNHGSFRGRPDMPPASGP